MSKSENTSDSTGASTKQETPSQGSSGETAQAGFSLDGGLKAQSQDGPSGQNEIDTNLKYPDTCQAGNGDCHRDSEYAIVGSDCETLDHPHTKVLCEVCYRVFEWARGVPEGFAIEEIERGEESQTEQGTLIPDTDDDQLTLGGDRAINQFKFGRKGISSD